MRQVLIALLAAVVIIAACAPEQAVTDSSTTIVKQERPAAPTAEEARTLLANAPEFGEYEFTSAGWTAPVSGVAMSEPVRAEAKQLAAAGWIALENTGDIALSDKSRNDKRFLMRENGLLDVVPLAKKEIGNVLAVRDRDGTVTVDFDWRWVPNEVGAAFKTGTTADRFAGPQQATAELIHDGTKWTVLQIKKRGL